MLYEDSPSRRRLTIDFSIFTYFSSTKLQPNSSVGLFKLYPSPIFLYLQLILSNHGFPKHLVTASSQRFRGFPTGLLPYVNVLIALFDNLPSPTLVTSPPIAVFVFKSIKRCYFKKNSVSQPSTRL